MAELAFGLASTLLEKLGSFSYQEISMAWGMKDDLKKLQETTSLLKAKLLDAEKKQQRSEELKLWLVRLKQVFNDAVDVLDVFECEVLRRQVVREYGTVGRKVRRFFSRSNPLVCRFSLAHQIKEIRQRLDDIAKEMAQFQLINTQLNPLEQDHDHDDLTQRTRGMTHSFVDPSDVIGRDHDKQQVMDMFNMHDEDNAGKNLSVIPIVGIGGLGKTTLAKSVYNDQKIVESFALRMWVCVSLEFDVIRLAREILKSAPDGGQDLRSLSVDRLQWSLRCTLEGKKFLLVLDDVWNEDRSKWIDLRQFLAGGAEGSKVVVTTRSRSVASIMSQIQPHQLEGLSGQDSLSLFFKHAFRDEKQVEQNPQLKDIGKEIVKKCAGVPLALKTLGSLLCSKTESEWRSVTDNEIWELAEMDGHILPALRLSYNALSPCSKQCFAYCSIFPEDAEMRSLELIWIWMALGIIQSPNEKMELEDIGELNFKELCNRSFFQCPAQDGYYETHGLSYPCQMHDLIHELASSVMKGECSIIKASHERVVPETVRHLRIFLDENNLNTLQKLSKVRSIYVDGTRGDDNVIESFLSMCVSRFRYLRVFDLRDLSFKVLPSSIGTLKHLRYLNLNGNEEIKKLPDSICKLQSLQSLLLGGCEELEELPRDIRNLVRLRNLIITTKQAFFPENGIGRLKSLQLLFISRCKNLKSLPTDLVCCTTLRTLIIGGCQHLDLASEPIAREVAQLRLQKLEIMGLPETTALPQWLEGAANTLQHLVIKDCEKVVALPEWFSNLRSLRKLVIEECAILSSLPDGMQRLTSLTHLEIKDCWQLNLASRCTNVSQLSLQKLEIMGLPETTALPQWLQGAANTLQHLVIKECEKVVALPEWFSNLRSLRKLVIEECAILSSLPDGMQRLTSLTHLEITNCEQLDLESGCNDVSQLSLQELEIWGLPETTALPRWLQGAANTLQYLVIGKCEKLKALPEWFSNLRSLRKLVIKRCEALSSLPEGMQRLTSLTHLEIKDCGQLDLESGCTSVSQLSLQELEIWGLPETTALPRWLQGAANTLQYLGIGKCEKLKALPDWLPTLKSLRELHIWRCKELSCLPDGMEHLTSLTELTIVGCPELEKRCEREIGADWQKIAHVPNLNIRLWKLLGKPTMN